MMEIYPYGGWLAYVQYHFLHGVIKQNLMLMDKTRYVHNAQDKKPVAQNPKSKEETLGILSRFGVGSEIDQIRKEVGD